MTVIGNLVCCLLLWGIQHVSSSITGALAITQTCEAAQHSGLFLPGLILPPPLATCVTSAKLSTSSKPVFSSVRSGQFGSQYVLQNSHMQKTLKTVYKYFLIHIKQIHFIYLWLTIECCSRLCWGCEAMHYVTFLKSPDSKSFG